MYSVTRLLDVADGDRDRILKVVRAGADGSGARHRIVEPTLAGARNGGDILVHLRFDSEDQWRFAERDFAAILDDAAITRVNGACYSGVPFRESSATGTVYRTLLLRVLPGTDIDTVARFEEELRLMPQYVNTITAWQLSRVDEPVGTSALDSRVRARVHRRRRAHGALPDASRSLGGGGPLVRSRMPGGDHPRSRMPQLLRAAVADPALAFLARADAKSPQNERFWALLRLLGRFLPPGYIPAGRIFGLAVVGGSRGGRTLVPSRAMHRELLRPRIMQAECHKTCALGGGHGDTSPTQSRPGIPPARWETNPESVVTHPVSGWPSTDRHS